MPFHYVYILTSIDFPDKSYIGCTADLKKRLTKHNNGEVKPTSRHKPWEVVSYFAFKEKDIAFKFEKYLKTGSGRAFSKKHFILFPIGLFYLPV